MIQPRLVSLLITCLVALGAGETATVEWTAAGDLTVATEQESGAAIRRFSRPPGRQDDAGATSVAIAANPGIWELSAAIRSELYAQDMSFNGSLVVEFLASDGQVAALRPVVTVQGRSAWRQLRRRILAPEGTVQARFSLRIRKTHGNLWLSGLTLERVGDLRVERRDRLEIRFSTARLGHLLLPDDPRRATVTVRAPEGLPEGQRTLRWWLRDWWGAEQTSVQTGELVGADQPGLFVAQLDLGGLGMEVGPWYGLHTEIPLGVDPARHDDFSLAVLPESRAAKFPAPEIPFGSHTWDATMADYFPLAARLGLRRCLVFWNWSPTAPYNSGYGTSGQGYDVRIGLPRSLGMQPYGMLYPIFDIERGKRVHSEASLRQGVRKSIEQYKPLGLWGFQNGNEPPSWDPAWVAKDVESYRIIYDEVKKTDPSVFVIGSAIGPSEVFFKAGFQGTQDAYNIHHYGDLGDLRRQMRLYQELFKTYGGKKPIYSTEIGSKSQGLSRHEIAMDLVKKAVCFFADGGGFFTWFAIGSPDDSGSRRGSYGDSMDLFAGYRRMWLPRLDAVAYYHLVDCMLDKRFAEERTWPGGIHAFLFRNPAGDCLQVLWTDREQIDLLLPLPGVESARLVQLDGRGSDLRCQGGGIGIRVSEEPQFITYRVQESALAERPSIAPLSVASAPVELTQGRGGEIVLAAPAGGRIELVGPPGWAITPAPAGAGKQAFSVAVPAGTGAGQASFRAFLRDETDQASALLAFRIPVVGRIQISTRPLPATAGGPAQVEFTLRNNGPASAPMRWQAQILTESSMARGTYDLRNPDPPSARFAEAAEGELSLASGQEVVRRLSLADIDRLAIHRIRVSASDDTGRETVAERLMGGFVGVPRAAKVPVLDGRLDDPAWATAPVLAINEDRQFFKSEHMGDWSGPEDLSGQVRMAWDADFLYLAVEVTDDVFVNPRQDGQLWNMDGLQILVDPFRDRSVRKGRYDYAFGHGQKGDQAWCHLSGDPSVKTGPAAEVRVASAGNGRGAGGRTYEVAIPWSRLAPFAPAPGRNLGLALVLNEDDGPGRGGFLAWFSGVHLKEVDLVGDLILVE